MNTLDKAQTLLQQEQTSTDEAATENLDNLGQV
jgi:hypothetical protein